MYKVAVLMSTYNGNKYLREQIESILTQDCVEVTLYIRDDGSSDNTIEIIKDFQKLDSRIKLDIGNNIGVGNSFMQLIYDVGNAFDYYAFSDQDDIWLSSKLISAINMINQYDNAVLYSSNQLLVDSELKSLGLRYSSKIDTSFRQTMCQNRLSGCTMVWNRQLQELLSYDMHRPSELLLKNRIHDVWLSMVADIFGTVIYDSKALILYRQHENNVVGVEKSNIIKQWISKIINQDKRNGRSAICKEIIVRFRDAYIPDYDFLEMCGYYQNDFSLKIKLLFDDTIITHTDESRLGYMLKVLFNLF